MRVGLPRASGRPYGCNPHMCSNPRVRIAVAAAVTAAALPPAGRGKGQGETGLHCYYCCLLLSDYYHELQGGGGEGIGVRGREEVREDTHLPPPSPSPPSPPSGIGVRGSGFRLRV